MFSPGNFPKTALFRKVVRPRSWESTVRAIGGRSPSIVSGKPVEMTCSMAEIGGGEPEAGCQKISEARA